MRIGIVPHAGLKNAIEVTKDVIDHLSEENIVVPKKIGKKIGREGTRIEKMNVETIITIGGDGTVLYTLQKLPNTPILGINMGKRGFLADVKPEEAYEALDMLIEDKIDIFERERLKVKVSGEKFGKALNEGAIRTETPTQLISFRVRVDGEVAEENEGDGLIVSTPTGSTAYSLAAGGPIIDPRVKASLVVPLSTHRPRSMPLVYPNPSKLEIDILKTKGKVDLTLDGQVTKKIEEEDKVSFTRAENGAKFYKWKRKFYEKMREKL